MENKEENDLREARDLSLELFKVLMSHNASNVVADMALTRLLAGLYSLSSPEVAEKLITLHCDNLRYSIREIRESENTENEY